MLAGHKAPSLLVTAKYIFGAMYRQWWDGAEGIDKLVANQWDHMVKIIFRCRNVECGDFGHEVLMIPNEMRETCEIL